MRPTPAISNDSSGAFEIEVAAGGAQTSNSLH
jgi:hypothetical protein